MFIHDSEIKNERLVCAPLEELEGEGLRCLSCVGSLGKFLIKFKSSQMM
jgi:hypothetical protein